MRSQSNSVKNLSLFICFGDVKMPVHLRPTQNYVLKQNSILQQGPGFSAQASVHLQKGSLSLCAEQGRFGFI